ncbi:profilin-like [Amphiura filiformis]|uniref:profilin-like n=1 Tax=Amphiura filiformis TaxID=82378 RepID=UPI003B2184C1
MSWDGYLDNCSAQSQDHIVRCCIISLDGGSVWNTTTHAKALKITPAEGAKIAKAFKDKNFSSFMSTGIYVEGQKFQFLREVEGKVMLGKKKGLGFVSFQSSKQAIICAFGSEDKQQGNANKGLSVVGDYLESVGY